jgi:hypothetical protein
MPLAYPNDKVTRVWTDHETTISGNRGPRGNAPSFQVSVQIVRPELETIWGALIFDFLPQTGKRWRAPGRSELGRHDCITPFRCFSSRSKDNDHGVMLESSGAQHDYINVLANHIGVPSLLNVKQARASSRCIGSSKVTITYNSTTSHP